MADERYHGHWWLPGEEDAAQPGTVSISDRGDVQLELIGGFDLAIRTPIDGGGYTTGSEERPIPIVLGNCAGRKVTLVDCFTTKSTKNLFTQGDHPDYHRIHAQTALFDIHTLDATEQQWSRAYVRLENFAYWLDTKAISHTLRDHPDGHVARIDQVPDRHAAHDGWTYTTVVRSSGFSFEHSRDGLSVTGAVSVVLQIEPPQPVALDGFDDAIKAFMDLLTISTGEACGVIRTVLVHENPRMVSGPRGEDVERDQDVIVHSRHIHSPDPTAPGTVVGKFRFTCADVPFEDVVPRWLALHGKARGGISAFLGLSYVRPGFTETRLLTVAIAAEALHREVFGDDAGAEMEPEKFRDLRDRLLETLTDKSERDWLKANLRNQPSYRRRILALAEEIDDTALQAMITDVTTWARDLTRARNGLAHTASGDRDARLLVLAETTELVLTLVLLGQLGLSADAQRRVARTVRTRYPI